MGGPGSRALSRSGVVLLAALAWAGCSVLEIVLEDPTAGDDDTTAPSDDDDTTAPTDDDDTTAQPDDDDDTMDDDDTADDDSADDDDTAPADADGDGWDETTDCDDTDPLVNPGAAELCDGVDNDCDGEDDDDCLDCDRQVPSVFTTIQAGIDSITWGEVVCVAPGTYTENLDFEGKVGTVVGVAGPTMTTVDGGAAGPVLEFSSAETTSAVFRGFTLTNGAHDRGAGVRIESASPTLQDVVIRDSVASNDGGGLYLTQSFAQLERVTVQDNTAALAGGGLYEYGSGAALRQVTFRGNTAVNGGGVYVGNSSCAYYSVVIANNTSTSHGGGMAVGTGGSPWLYNVAITGNVASGDGGGLHANGGSPSPHSMIVAGNRADGGDGGGVHLDAFSNVTFHNVSVVGNVATGSGGGLASVSSSGGLYEVSITGNTAGSLGGGLWVSGIEPIPSHGNIWGNAPDDVAGMVDPEGSNDNISADPGFLDTTAPDALDWDLHLDPSSSLVDAGSGDPDPDGGTADIGAYGGSRAGLWDLDGDGYPAWWQPGPYDGIDYPGEGWDCDDRDPFVHPGNGGC